MSQKLKIKARERSSGKISSRKNFFVSRIPNFTDGGLIIQGECLKVMSSLPSASVDMIFADPPYRKYDITKLVEPVLEHLNKKGKFILECDKKIDPFLEAIVKDYGQTRVLFWENA